MTDDGDLLNILHHRNPWWRGKSPAATIDRVEVPEVLRWAGSDQVLALCGMRRSGKTSLLRLVAAQRALRADSPVPGASPGRSVLFVDFEEHGFGAQRGDPSFPERLFRLYLQHIEPAELPLVLLDEVQEVPEWSRWVRSVVETGRATVAVTGSSSQLIEPELARVLTGRHVTLPIHPLCFADALRFRRQLEVDEASALPLRDLETCCHDYLRYGGLPRVTLEARDDDREHLLSEYFEQILVNDVIGRHGLRARDQVRSLALHLLRHTGTQITWVSLKKKLALSMDQVREWTEHLVDARLVHLVRRLSRSPGEAEQSPRKVYAGDLGVRHATTLQFSPDLGHLAETAVFLQLLRARHSAVLYWQGDRECDFVLWRGDRAVEAIQVCYTDSAMPEREQAGLLEAMRTWGLSVGTLITRDQSETIRLDGREIRCVPLARWLLTWGEP